MRSIVLASILGSAAVGYSVPLLSGPIHFQTTKPYSLFGQFNFAPTPTVFPLGVVPLDFVMTDVLVGVTPSGPPPQHVMVTVNGSPVFNCGCTPGGTATSVIFFSRSEHLTNGLLIPAGSTVGVQAVGYSFGLVPITLVGYLQ